MALCIKYFVRLRALGVLKKLVKLTLGQGQGDCPAHFETSRNRLSMSVYPPTPRVQFRGAATMLPYKPPVAETQSAPTPQIANLPTAVSLAQAAGSALSVTWAFPDRQHARWRYRVHSAVLPVRANAWTVVSGVSSPYLLSGLIAGAAVDVQVQATNAAGQATCQRQ